MASPETVLPEVVTRLRRVPDAERRNRLLAALIALIPEEEIIEMVERLIDREELLLDTPFLRRLREEGRAEGQVAGALMARRHSILDVLAWRFDPPVSIYQQVERVLETITDEAQLAALLTTAVQADSVAAFQAALDRTRRESFSEERLPTQPETNG